MLSPSAVAPSLDKLGIGEIFAQAPERPSQRDLSSNEGECLLDTLQRAATGSAGITFYKTNGSTEMVSERVTYRELLDQAWRDAVCLQMLREDCQEHTVFLLHFDTHEENIRWFWAVTAAGYLPCIVPKFASSDQRRISQAEHILRLLDGPIILTNSRMSCAFSGVKAPNLYLADDLTSNGQSSSMALAPLARNQPNHDLGALMLTSGSTGFSKAVCLRQSQMLAAVAGKAAHCRSTPQDVFMSWIALDHVVNLVEMHLHAMQLGAEQVQVSTQEVLKDPLLFLELVDRHRVSLSFAPNFFLALLSDRVCESDFGNEAPAWDLSCLRCVFSGGEATVRQMAADISRDLQRFGAQPFIRAGYGLTESCAGMIWDVIDHTVDELYNTPGEFLTCGLPISGVQMRVISDVSGKEAKPCEEGVLQLRGPVMFREYYRDPSATSAAFTNDGWFITGDNSYLDDKGQLYITGRTKDTLLINGLTIFSVEVEHSIEQALIPGVTPSYTLVFAHRPAGAVTESYCVIYLPSYNPDDSEARVQTTDAIERIASLVVHVKPAAILPISRSYFEKSSLGKLSRAHYKRLFENGTLDQEKNFHVSRLQAYRQAHRQPPSSPIEEKILDLVCARLALEPSEVSVTSNLFQLGLSSLDFYTTTQDLHRTFDCHITLPDLLADPSISGLAYRVSNRASHTSTEYNPIIPLQPHGSKTPLWLVHPASGNVLIFTALARAFHDRPVYAFRARGTQPGEPLFTSISEMADTYAAALLEKQPKGPYALAGYSLGSSIAFEVVKRLEATGAEVRFFGTLDGPPDVATLVGKLTWTEALVMIGYFYELISEQRCIQLMPELRDQDTGAALDIVLGEADPHRVKVLGLERSELIHVTDVTHGFCHAAGKWAASGYVQCAVDIFAVEPLLTVTNQKDVWINDYLGQWQALSTRGMDVHLCEGRHADMLGPKFVNSLALILRRVLSERGV
ncbi:hypothetical protein N7478_006282 [Penicillium angulare]|uniref:uncharacterized protein n=1 Tax=Penicillium angulare TaxID=116970 RepID=UPI002540F89F|nr:uncharacterized protein N7478_006282 [Penicillium angulare]KAJ5280910.1 hypothetical protein N7478_006282 [Penicillium angulare]